jgi:hypothetical protein
VDPFAGHWGFANNEMSLTDARGIVQREEKRMFKIVVQPNRYGDGWDVGYPTRGGGLFVLSNHTTEAEAEVDRARRVKAETDRARAAAREQKDETL